MRRTVCAFLVAAALLLLPSTACAPRAESMDPSPSPDAPTKEDSMLTLSSPAFEDGGLIATEFANSGVSGGQNVSIPYEWAGAPDGVRSFVLMLVDRHPRANSWVHWLVTAMPPDAASLPRGASRTTSMPKGSREHINSFGTIGYGGPQPPPGSGKHEYEAVLYAIDTTVELPERTTLNDVLRAIDGHVLATANCSGFFGR